LNLVSSCSFVLKQEPYPWMVFLTALFSILGGNPWIGFHMGLAWYLSHVSKASYWMSTWGIPILVSLLAMLPRPLNSCITYPWIALVLYLATLNALFGKWENRPFQNLAKGLIAGGVWAIGRTHILHPFPAMALLIPMFLTLLILENSYGSFWKSIIRLGIAGFLLTRLLHREGMDLLALWAWFVLTFCLLLLLESLIGHLIRWFFVAPVLYAVVGWVSGKFIQPMVIDFLGEGEMAWEYFPLVMAAFCMIWGETRRVLRALYSLTLVSILPFLFWLGGSLLVSPGLSYLPSKDIYFISILSLGIFIALSFPEPQFELASTVPGKLKTVWTYISQISRRRDVSMG